MYNIARLTIKVFYPADCCTSSNPRVYIPKRQTMGLILGPSERVFAPLCY